MTTTTAMTTEAGAAREYSRGMTSGKRGLQETLADDDYDYTSEILCFRSGKKIQLMKL
jgi:hypothetical protein